MPLDPEAKALLDFIGFTDLPPIESSTPQIARERSKGFLEARRRMGIEPVDEVSDLRIPGPDGEIPARIYAPAITRPAPALIYFHGGGWVIGDIESHDHICRMLANRAGCIVVSVDYRLAPEAKFPAAVEDSYAATEWTTAHAAELGIDRNRIAVGGDSAGGNLSAVVTQIARDRGGPKLIYQLLIYPATDMTMGLPSIQENAAGPLLTKGAIDWFIGHYLRGEEDRTNPLASPLLTENLSHLPPAFILTAECDPIRDEGEAYGQKLQAAGVQAEVKRYPGMPHGFFGFAAALAKGREAVEDSVERLKRAFGLNAANAQTAS